MQFLWYFFVCLYKQSSRWKVVFDNVELHTLSFPRTITPKCKNLILSGLTLESTAVMLLFTEGRKLTITKVELAAMT